MALSLLVLVPTSLLSVALTSTDLSPSTMKIWMPKIFVALCITNSAFCSWGTARISTNLIVYGGLCIVGYGFTACCVAYRFSKQRPLTPSEIKGNETKFRKRREENERQMRFREARDRRRVNKILKGSD